MLRLFHRDLGGAGRPPLVLLHGMLGSSRNWVSAGADLAENFHVLAPDLRNHGGSSHDVEMTYEAMAADVLAWLDHEGIGRANVLGHSMGGKVAMLLACRQPARVGRLLVVDIAPRDYFWPAHRETFAALNELPLDGLRSRGDAETHFAKRVPDLGLRKFLATNLTADPDGRWRWQVNLPVLTAALPHLEGNPLAPADRFSGPTLFVAGGKSTYIESRDHDAIRTHFPGAGITVIADSRHSPHMETRPEFVRTVRNFAG